MSKCERPECAYICHSDIENNGGTHCCRACKNEGIHGPACEHKLFTQAQAESTALEIPTHESQALPKVAIHTVFIAKENILFLPEWIAYHYVKGVRQFYLYDNTGVEELDPFDKLRNSQRIIPNKVNKYGFNYEQRIKMTAEEIFETLETIKNLYEPGVINYIKWQPKNAEGRILYGQEKAIDDVRQRFGSTIDWLISIDMDEYVVSVPSIPEVISSVEKQGYSCIEMSEIPGKNRFLMPDSLIIETSIFDNIPNTDAKKNIYKIKTTANAYIHRWVGTENAKKIEAPIELICYNHYKYKSDNKYPPNISIPLIEEAHDLTRYIGSASWRSKYI